MRKLFKIILIVLHICIQATVFAQNKENENAKNAALNDYIASLKKDVSLRQASWGLYAANVKTGQVLAEYNADLLLIPASTMKIVTTAAALAIHSDTFKFSTSLAYDGKIDSMGVLNGNLFIIGTGDPTFASTRIDSEDAYVIMDVWVKNIEKLGIKKIQGNIVIDGSMFDDEMVSPGWIWNDIGNYYGAGANAINVNENCFSLFFKAGKNIGDSAMLIKTFPELPFVKFQNNVTTARAGSGDNVVVYGSPFSNFRKLTGTIPLGSNNFEVKASIPDPGYLLAFILRKKLLEKNIEFVGNIINQIEYNNQRKTYTAQRAIICQKQSPLLAEIVNHTNTKSINCYAEALLKSCGYQVSGLGSTANGVEAILGFWEKLGVDVKSIIMKDGSGLSPQNRISAKQMTQILIAAKQLKSHSLFYNSLAIAGKSGSIAGLFKGTVAEGNLRAKSGFLSTVRAYAGYVTNSSNNEIAFAVMVNNYSGSKSAMKEKLEQLMLKIAESK